MRTLLWYREHDLRLADHQPLRRAIDGGEVLPCFVLPIAEERRRWEQEAPHRAQVLYEALIDLRESWQLRGSDLALIEGDAQRLLPVMARSWNIDRVCAHRCVDPGGRALERKLSECLGDRLELFEGVTLRPLGTLRSGGGGPYKVYTPYARAHRAATEVGVPLPAPRRLPPWPGGLDDGDVRRVNWAELERFPRDPALITAGETAARKRLKTFLSSAAARYDTDRDRMDRDGCSRVSVDLRLGAVSARAVWRAVQATDLPADAQRVFCNQMLWREFSYDTLFDRPELLERPFRRDFEGFPWQQAGRLWRAWVNGETGYPVVDAAARQLLAEGHVHNRARMIAASFLTKHCLISYCRGEMHYMHHLCDGDWAQNNAGWQWSAGCGCDAQPYFRVFNPELQGRKFDPEGDYVRRWVPELAGMPARWIHAPGAAPVGILAAAGVRMGVNYPTPVVDHKEARETFLRVAKDWLGGQKN